MTTVAVLAAAVSAHADGRLDRVLVAAVDAPRPRLVRGRRHASRSRAGARRDARRRSPRSRAARPTGPRHRPSTPRARRSGRRRPSRSNRSPRATRRADAPVLRDLDLVIEPGRRIALVGESGAGKSTVTSLLFRFLDPETGRVTIDGRDIREMRQEDVRRTFALAGQEAHVFNSTIRENLLSRSPGQRTTS